MHVEIVPNRGSKPAILLRESFREGKKVRKRTLGNISKLPMNQVEAIRRVLKGEQLVSTDELFEIITDGSPAHGNVEAVMTTMRRLRVANLLCSRSSRQRDLVIAMVGARILKPRSKLATSRSWSSTTLSDMLGLGDADEDELYDAMDWLLERQEDIEKKLAARHFTEGDLALYDLTSSYFEGVTCPLAALGHNRDGKKGKLQVNYGLLANDRGIPVAVSVFKGNSGDSDDPAGPGRHVAAALRHRAVRARRRPGDDHPEASRCAPCDRRGRLADRAAPRSHPQARQRRRHPDGSV